MSLELFDPVFHHSGLARPTHSVNEHHVLEALIHLGVLDETHEWSRTGSGTQKVQALAGFEVGEAAACRGLTADQNLVALANVLQTRGQRAVGNLDAEELEMLLVVRAGDAVSPQQRTAVHVQSDHDKPDRSRNAAPHPAWS